MDQKQYEADSSGHSAPADAAPDSPHGGLGKGKQEGIEHALRGEALADQPVIQEVNIDVVNQPDAEKAEQRKQADERARDQRDAEARGDHEAAAGRVKEDDHK